MSVVSDAFDVWRECRAAFDDVLYAAYLRAERETNGALLNERGRRAGVDAASLFMGTAVRAYAYASPELVDHWEKHPRTTYAAFERQWVAGRDEREEEQQWAS